MTSIGKCPHHYWVRIKSVIGDYYIDTCVSCGYRVQSLTPRPEAIGETIDFVDEEELEGRKCQRHNWQSMFDSEGFTYEEVCLSCGERRIAAKPYGHPYPERDPE